MAYLQPLSETSWTSWSRSRATGGLVHITGTVVHIFTDRISLEGNGITSVRPSVRLSVRLFPFYLQNRPTVDLELLHVSRS